MTDRELLELAAKAAGVDWIPASSDVGKQGELKFGLWLNIQHEPTEATRRRFNPLNDDGDALRLAVQLDIEVRHVNGAAHAGRANYFWCTEDWFPDGDKVSATRRAIVRAAAELAKQEVKP